MLIRNYNENDINCITNLGKKLHKNYDFNLDSFSNCLVIEETNILIGFIIYSIIYERAEIVDIIIDDSFRGNGYGYTLLNKAIEIINNKNVLNITLEVNKNNLSAINLYKKVGFEICAERKNYYEGQDGYLMKKDLR